MINYITLLIDIGCFRMAGYYEGLPGGSTEPF